MAEPWRQVQFEDLLVMSRSGYWGDEVASEARPNPVRVIRNADVTRDGQLSGWAERFFSDKELSRASLQFGDTVLCTSGEVGKALLVTREGFAATNFTRVLRPDVCVVDPRYLRILLDGPALKQQMAQHTGATTLANLRTSFYSAASIDLPSLGEQRRIVDLVESVDAYVDALRAEADAARAARTSLLHDLLNAGGEDWEETTLGDIADYINGYPFKPSELGDVGLPVIRIKQLLDPSEELDRSVVEVPSRSHVADGDLIFSWSGTLAVRVWDRGPALLNQHLFRVVEKEGVQRDWLAIALDHALHALAQKAHGTTMKHITKKALLPHPVTLPPLAEQRRMADLVSTLDGAVSAVDAAVDRAIRLRSALLSDLLSGIHEIPESYDALLEAS